MYFALVGIRLDLSTGFDVLFFLALLAYASALKSASVYVGARWAGERPVGARNLAAALNCRGGPGIVLASLAYDAGIGHDASTPGSRSRGGNTRRSRKDTSQSPHSDAAIPQARGGPFQPDRGNRGIGDRSRSI